MDVIGNIDYVSVGAQDSSAAIRVKAVRVGKGTTAGVAEREEGELDVGYEDEVGEVVSSCACLVAIERLVSSLHSYRGNCMTS